MLSPFQILKPTLVKANRVLRPKRLPTLDVYGYVQGLAGFNPTVVFLAWYRSTGIIPVYAETFPVGMNKTRRKAQHNKIAATVVARKEANYPFHASFPWV
jgi:hypothetical protein